jgi:NAD(P)-dependent dehydrogenase (short-subunit alcohol dehydrogenase family)
MGAQVILAARDTDKLERVKREIEDDGGVAGIAQLELTDEFSVAKLVDLVESLYRRCDVLVNNAGIGLMGQPLHEMAPTDWDMLMGTNLRGPYLMIRAFAPLMIAAKSGHIVNISSLAGRNPLANGAACRRNPSRAQLLLHEQLASGTTGRQPCHCRLDRVEHALARRTPRWDWPPPCNIRSLEPAGLAWTGAAKHVLPAAR